MTYLLFLLGFLLLPVHAHAGLTIDDFQQYPAGKLPAKWRTWPFQRGKAAGVYSVKSENDNNFLSATDSNGVSVQILRDFNWKIENYPVLSWKWRAVKLPVNANETDPSTNDSACGVYVVFSKTRQEMLKYTWSTTAPIGTVYEKRPGKAYIIVAESGSKHLNSWLAHAINVTADYKKYFHKDLDKNPSAIAVLTDGNATKTEAACDYDEFAIGGEK
ncbi:MAG: DUF3047 domain-containing protein [Deltaproteobacteria bacterium]|nr:DUF3047 domain-containing protein [Deltaproteobacteria bacterium]